MKFLSQYFLRFCLTSRNKKRMNPNAIFPGREKPKVKVYLQFFGTSNDVHQENTYH